MEKKPVFINDEPHRFACLLGGCDIGNSSEGERVVKFRALCRMLIGKNIRLVDALELEEIREAVDEQLKPERQPVGPSPDMVSRAEYEKGMKVMRDGYKACFFLMVMAGIAAIWGWVRVPEKVVVTKEVTREVRVSSVCRAPQIGPPKRPKKVVEEEPIIDLPVVPEEPTGAKSLYEEPPVAPSAREDSPKVRERGWGWLSGKRKPQESEAQSGLRRNSQ